MASPPILDWQLDEDRFVALLEKLINEARYLQNNPPECVPKEDRAVRHVLDVLQPYSEEEGGPLHIQHVSYVEGRGNLVITYKGSHPSSVLSFVGCHMDVVTANPDDWVPPSPSNLLSFVGCHMDIVTANPDDWVGATIPSNLLSFVGCHMDIVTANPDDWVGATIPSNLLSFVGCHMDVVTANPDDWNFGPLTFSRDGDKLRGRGIADCLGGHFDGRPLHFLSGRGQAEGQRHHGLPGPRGTRHGAHALPPPSHILSSPHPTGATDGPPGPRGTRHVAELIHPHSLVQTDCQPANSSFPPLTFSHLVRPLPSPLLYQDFDPFTFSRDGDKLRGRGTTDCLGHVALVTELMRQLAVCRPELGATVVAVLIANEENATVKDIGVDGLVKAGLLDHLRNGPLFWVDTADKQPCIGTGGMLAWKLKAFGKLFHSGLPHKAVNPIELAMTALAEIQTRFYHQPPSPQLHPSALLCTFSLPGGEPYRAGHDSTGGDTGPLLPGLPSACHGEDVWAINPIEQAMTAIAEIHIRFYRDFPPHAVNPIELGMTALAEIQTRFYRDFPPHEMEKTYGFATPSTMKPTQWSSTALSLPSLCSVDEAAATRSQHMAGIGTKFVDEVAAKLREYVADINANLSTLSGPGPCSKFVLPEENLQGRLELEIAEAPMKGVACNLDSPGYHALVTATKDVMGECKPYSITGSLPLIRDLQEAGFDVQTMGYGVMATYHARNEYALLSDFKLGYRVLTNLIHRLS
ncbi:unnamed protein product [Closterium sp. NIES-64]|nr:unnamed protein product [Closterium sp. NIES-64]